MFVYLTGGIGTGKSTVLSMFADLGARIVSADVIVHALLATPELQSIIEGMLDLEDASQRSTIAKRVFADPDALRKLEQLLHPLVASEIEELRATLPADEILVYEVPLPPDPRPGEVVITVEAPMDVRLERLQARGITRTDAQARIAVQADDDAYRHDAAHVIVNDGDETQLHDAVVKVWEVLRNATGNL